MMVESGEDGGRWPEMVEDGPWSVMVGNAQDAVRFYGSVTLKTTV